MEMKYFRWNGNPHQNFRFKFHSDDWVHVIAVDLISQLSEILEPVKNLQLGVATAAVIKKEYKDGIAQQHYFGRVNIFIQPILHSTDRILGIVVLLENSIVFQA